MRTNKERAKLLQNLRDIRIFEAMKIGFDPAKDERNVTERGLPFALVEYVIEGKVGEYEDTRRDYSEVRINLFGLVEGRLFAATYTMRGDVTWVISLRKANTREQKRWLG